MQTAPRGGAERAARPDSFLWGAGHGGAVRPQAERGSLGGGDNGFYLKGGSDPEQRTAGRPAPRAVSCSAPPMLECDRTEHTLRWFYIRSGAR